MRKLALVIAALASLQSCKTVADPPVPAALLMVGPPDTSITAGSSFEARSDIFDQLGNSLTDRRPRYRSLTTDVLSVSGDGLVTGEAAGIGQIEALLASLRDTLRVTVLDARILARIPMSGEPFGIAVATNGSAITTRLMASAATRVNLITRSALGSTVTGSAPTHVILNAAGTTAYVSNQISRTISVLSMATGAATATLPTAGNPYPMQVRNAGDYLYYVTNLNRLYRAELPSGTPRDSLQLAEMAHHLLLHPDEDRLYVATRDGGSVLEVNAQTLAVLRTFTTGGRTQALAIAPDKSELFVANEHGWLNVINLATGSVTATITLAGGAFGLTLGPDGTSLYVGLTTSGMIQVIDRATRGITATIITRGGPREMAAYAAGNVVVVANEGGWIDLVR